MCYDWVDQPEKMEYIGLPPRNEFFNKLKGENIDLIVGFVYNSLWVQVPIQIDEKHWQDWVTIKNGDCRF